MYAVYVCGLIMCIEAVYKIDTQNCITRTCMLNTPFEYCFT